MNDEAIKRIEAIFERYCFGYHFFLEDFRSQETVELGENRAYPIASCFKTSLAKLVFQRLDFEKESSSLKLDLNVDQNYAAASILSRLSGEYLELEIQQIVELMISTSDGLSTDRLIEWVGLQALNAFMASIAPNTSLPLKLDEMVREIWKLPGVQNAKSTTFTLEQSVDLMNQVVAFGATNAKDLALLAQHCYPPTFEQPELNDSFAKAISVARYIPRCEMFFNSEMPRCISKTGSMIDRYFMNDHGVFVDKDKQTNIASFAYCSHGWKLPSLTCETIGGLIGLEIAKALHLNPKPNLNWSPQTEELFLSGI